MASRVIFVFDYKTGYGSGEDLKSMKSLLTPDKLCNIVQMFYF